MNEITTYDMALIRRKRLRQWINDRHNGSQADFIEVTGINQGELSGLLGGKKSFGEKKARKLELQGGIPFGWLDEAEEGMDIAEPNFGAYRVNNLGMGTRRIPVISSKEAASWDVDKFNPEKHTDWQVCTTNAPQNAYGLIMPDDKMTAQGGRSIPVGATVIIEPDREPVEGNIVAVSVGGAVMIKELVFDGANRYLRSFNQHYAPILINDDYKIIGVAVDLIITSSLL